MDRHFPHIFVLHVSKGYDDRARHIDAMMKRLGLDYEYILEGDLDDIDSDIMARYFHPDGELSPARGATSCSYKHLLACRRIIDRGMPGAVVLEDDIVLGDRFEEIVMRSIGQLPDGDPAIINYEDTRLRFVPRSKRRRGQVIYPGDRDRFTGALYVTAEAAAKVLATAETEKMSVPIDIFHRRLLDRGIISYWWSHPCVASQGSFSGLFASSVSKESGKALVWRLKRAYRRLLYFFR